MVIFWKNSAGVVEFCSILDLFFCFTLQSCFCPSRLVCVCVKKIQFVSLHKKQVRDLRHCVCMIFRVVEILDHVLSPEAVPNNDIEQQQQPE